MDQLFPEYFHIAVDYKRPKTWEKNNNNKKNSDRVDCHIYKEVQIRACEMVQWAEEHSANLNSQRTHGEKRSDSY